MGRPRKHASLHKFDGSYVPSRHDLGADNLASVGQCAATRELTDRGREEFRRVLAAYPPGTLGESDSEPLTQYCEWVQRMDEVRRLEVETGQLMVRQAAEISKHCLQFASRFGLTPADRGKVKIAPSQQSQGVAAFFRGTG